MLGKLQVASIIYSTQPAGVNLSTQTVFPLLPICPPDFCEYAGGACDQSWDGLQIRDGFAVYASEPGFIAEFIESAVRRVIQTQPPQQWLTWRELGISGQIIFCKICKALRSSRRIVADITTLNQNVMFEIGYTLGIGIPLQLVRDKNYAVGQNDFDELGMLDTVGYDTFENSDDLVTTITRNRDGHPLTVQKPSLNREQPLYLLKSHIQTEGMVRLMSGLKKSGLRFRTFDPKETARLSLHDALKQVQSSFGIIVHSIDPQRYGARVNNARCALIAGIALAQGKRVLMLQEGDFRQPIDYRDVAKSYAIATQVPDLLLPIIKGVVEELQSSQFVAVALPLNLLEKVDLGDLAAENEIKGLTSYFVPTGQYNEAKRGRASLVVGRKGAGKTAIFYGVRSTYKPSRAHLVLDLKPEGHQFTKLREAILRQVSPGVQQHILTAFWNYLLLKEIARKVLEEDAKLSYQTPERRSAWLGIQTSYGEEDRGDQGDFSERLLALVDDIIRRGTSIGNVLSTPQVTELVYGSDIKALSDSLTKYMAISRKEDVWLLVDNLDKSWPVQSAQKEDILLLRSLLEASRKLQRQFESRGTECHVIVFIRNDIYEHLVRETSDRGKDTAVTLEWDDPEVFKEIIKRRIAKSTGLTGDFDSLWRIIFDSHVRGEESFSYILSRTLMRPREVLRFCRNCVDVALSRGREKVFEADILQAEKQCSEDALVDLCFELEDVDQRYRNVPYAFIGADLPLIASDVNARLQQVGLSADEAARAIDLLLWFGFLGYVAGADEERFSHQYQHDLRKMRSGLISGCSHTVHPAFREALGCAYRQFPASTSFAGSKF